MEAVRAVQWGRAQAVEKPAATVKAAVAVVVKGVAGGAVDRVSAVALRAARARPVGLKAGWGVEGDRARRHRKGSHTRRP